MYFRHNQQEATYLFQELEKVVGGGRLVDELNSEVKPGSFRKAQRDFEGAKHIRRYIRPKPKVYFFQRLIVPSLSHDNASFTC